jgi:hypothetical protein
VRKKCRLGHFLLRHANYHVYKGEVQANEREADTKNTYHGTAARGIRMQQNENKAKKI